MTLSIENSDFFFHRKLPLHFKSSNKNLQKKRIYLLSSANKFVAVTQHWIPSAPVPDYHFWIYGGLKVLVAH